MAPSVDHNFHDGYFDLGSFSRPVTTKHKETQRWFDRGLTWAYSFNHKEAAKCFETAISYDPECAIAYWGLAFASGPNYNKTWELFDKQDLIASVHKTYDASRRAMELINNASPFECALIEATQPRYEREHDVDWDRYRARNTAYADAMKDFYEKYPDDLDACTLYADAMMNLTPWKLWDLHTGEPGKGTRTLEIQAVLEHGLNLKGARNHPGILHMYIHCIEMSPFPEKGLNAADHLRNLVPDGGHMHHMPSHLDVLVGDYRRAMAANYNATIADEKFVAKNGAMNFYTFYRMHNYHSLIYSTMHAGKKVTAFETLDRMEGTLPIEYLRVESPPMADWLEAFFAVRAHVMIRFGMWGDILSMPLPEDQELFCVTTATLHYAKGIAAAATGNIPVAEEHRRLFQTAYKRVPPSRKDYPNRCVDILGVAEAMLDSELNYRKGNYELAFEQLREAIHRDDNLVYSEPWGWMQPVRHAYAALLLEQDRVEEAAEIYCDDLGLNGTLARAHQHPNNVWALKGYHECLQRLGRDKEAKLLELSLKTALAVADIKVEYSCFCRGTTPNKAETCCR
ncbi:hypothetical protein IFM5058_08793 [Aspergillus udagawae]|nr:hypothetical protein IFM5058_08793 [Aspergillus udagawae]